MSYKSLYDERCPNCESDKREVSNFVGPESDRRRCTEAWHFFYQGLDERRLDEALAKLPKEVPQRDGGAAERRRERWEALELIVEWAGDSIESYATGPQDRIDHEVALKKVLAALGVTRDEYKKLTGKDL